MLEHLELQQIVLRAVIAGPNVGLLEPHAIEMARGQTVETVGALLGIGERVAVALDHARLAANVVRGAAMAGRMGENHLDGVTGGIDRLPPRLPLRLAHLRASNSARI